MDTEIRYELSQSRIRALRQEADNQRIARLAQHGTDDGHAIAGRLIGRARRLVGIPAFA